MTTWESAKTQFKNDVVRGVKISDARECKGMTRKQAAEKLGISYKDISNFLYDVPEIRKILVKEGQQSTNDMNGVLFEAEDDEVVVNIGKRTVNCWTGGCEGTATIKYIDKDTPKGSEHPMLCAKCLKKDHDSLPGSGITGDDKKKISSYDPDTRGFLPGLDGPVREIKGEEFDLLAAEYLPEIQAEAKGVQ